MAAGRCGVGAVLGVDGTGCSAIYGYNISSLNNTINDNRSARDVSKLVTVKVRSCLWVTDLHSCDVSGGTGLMFHYTWRLALMFLRNMSCGTERYTLYICLHQLSLSCLCSIKG